MHYGMMPFLLHGSLLRWALGLLTTFWPSTDSESPTHPASQPSININPASAEVPLTGLKNNRQAGQHLTLLIRSFSPEWC